MRFRRVSCALLKHRILALPIVVSNVVYYRHAAAPKERRISHGSILPDTDPVIHIVLCFHQHFALEQFVPYVGSNSGLVIGAVGDH